MYIDENATKLMGDVEQVLFAVSEPTQRIQLKQIVNYFDGQYPKISWSVSGSIVESIGIVTRISERFRNYHGAVGYFNEVVV
jgi:hypothetical protein|tara:strand:+ start:226 stop:471 length:246 start_codon:yes stop_codon:yes gene_type:complete